MLGENDVHVGWVCTKGKAKPVLQDDGVEFSIEHKNKKKITISKVS